MANNINKIITLMVLVATSFVLPVHSSQTQPQEPAAPVDDCHDLTCENESPYAACKKFCVENKKDILIIASAVTGVAILAVGYRLRHKFWPNWSYLVAKLNNKYICQEEVPVCLPGERLITIKQQYWSRITDQEVATMINKDFLQKYKEEMAQVHPKLGRGYVEVANEICEKTEKRLREVAGYKTTPKMRTKYRVDACQECLFNLHRYARCGNIPQLYYIIERCQKFLPPISTIKATGETKFFLTELKDSLEGSNKLDNLL